MAKFMLDGIEYAGNSTSAEIDMSPLLDAFYGSLQERETLANAITLKGVHTNVSDSLTTMADNVSNLSVGKFLGTLSYTAANQTKTMDVSTILSNYKSLTVHDFKAYIADSNHTKQPGDAGAIVLNYKAPVISYDPSTGILSVTGAYYAWTAANWGQGNIYFSKMAVLYIPA